MSSLNSPAVQFSTTKTALAICAAEDSSRDRGAFKLSEHTT
jgi:hypothetical protein